MNIHIYYIHLYISTNVSGCSINNFVRVGNKCLYSMYLSVLRIVLFLEIFRFSVSAKNQINFNLANLSTKRPGLHIAFAWLVIM